MIGCIGHDGDCCVNRDADMSAAIEKAVQAEREACAKICEQVMTGGIQAYAAAIRARGNK